MQCALRSIGGSQPLTPSTDFDGRLMRVAVAKRSRPHEKTPGRCTCLVATRGRIRDGLTRMCLCGCVVVVVVWVPQTWALWQQAPSTAPSATTVTTTADTTIDVTGMTVVMIAMTVMMTVIVTMTAAGTIAAVATMTADTTIAGVATTAVVTGMMIAVVATMTVVVATMIAVVATMTVVVATTAVRLHVAGLQIMATSPASCASQRRLRVPHTHILVADRSRRLAYLRPPHTHTLATSILGAAEAAWAGSLPWPARLLACTTPHGAS